MTVKQPAKKAASKAKPVAAKRQDLAATHPANSPRVRLLVLLFTILCVAFTASACWRYA